jgi:hypothetical protein
MKQEKLFDLDKKRPPPKNTARRKHNPGQLKIFPTKQMLKEAAQEKARLFHIDRMERYKEYSIEAISKGTWPVTHCYDGTEMFDERNPYIICWAIRECCDNSATAQWDTIINFLVTWWPFGDQMLRWGLGGSFRASQKYGYIEHVRPKTWRLRPAGYDLLKEINL